MTGQSRRKLAEQNRSTSGLSWPTDVYIDHFHAFLTLLMLILYIDAIRFLVTQCSSSIFTF